MPRLVVLQRWRGQWLARVYRRDRLLALGAGSWSFARRIAILSGTFKAPTESDKLLSEGVILGHRTDVTERHPHADNKIVHADAHIVCSRKKPQ